MNTTDPKEIGWFIVDAVVGSRVWFAGEKQPYRVRARSGRFLVCTKPFNVQRTVLYCIIDLVLKVRGPEDLIFGMGAESDENCADMIDRLEGREKVEPGVKRALKQAGVPPLIPHTSRVSRRHGVPLQITRLNLPYILG